jgi:hypothetical protein
MARQQLNWTCSVCSTTWVLQATGALDPSMDVYDARKQVGDVLGYPSCVDETYGCKSIQCVVDAFASYGLMARQVWATFDQAYAIARVTTGVINPIGMYHFMGIRGVTDGLVWVANSATPGYDGVYDTLSRDQFNALGPVQLVYLEQPQPS